MLKQWWLISLTTLVCLTAGFQVAQSSLSNPFETIGKGTGDDMIDGVGGGILGHVHQSQSLQGESCTGPMVPCAAGPSPDCDTGDCTPTTSLMVPTCVRDWAWMGTFHCYQSGMECANGVCPDGFQCFTTVPGACSADWWWF
jgi:hypothetical protein